MDNLTSTINFFAHEKILKVLKRTYIYLLNWKKIAISHSTYFKITRKLGYGVWKCQGEMGLRQVEHGFSSFFGNFLAYLMIF